MSEAEARSKHDTGANTHNNLAITRMGGSTNASLISVKVVNDNFGAELDQKSSNFGAEFDHDALWASNDILEECARLLEGLVSVLQVCMYAPVWRTLSVCGVL